MRNTPDTDAHLLVRKHHFTPTEFGILAGWSRQKVVKLIEEGRIPAHRTPGGHWRIPAAEVLGGRDAGKAAFERIPIAR